MAQVSHQQQQSPPQVNLFHDQPMPETIRSNGHMACTRRLMEYRQHKHCRPPDITPDYWVIFARDFYSENIKKRWCLSHINVGQQAQAQRPWVCNLCGSQSGRGYEANFHDLIRFNQLKFSGGILDETLSLDMPSNRPLPSGEMILEYGRAVQKLIYENTRVVIEGKLRITFTNDFNKILSWEFCIQRREEFIPHRLLVPSVNQLYNLAKEYGNVTRTGSQGASTQSLQTLCEAFSAAGNQLINNMKLKPVNELGLPRQHFQGFQFSGGINTMTGLVDPSRQHNAELAESSRNYARQAMHPGLSAQTNYSNQMVGQNTVGLSNYQNILRQGMMNLNPIGFQGSVLSIPESLQNASVNNILLQQNPQLFSQGNQVLQQHMIQQEYQAIRTNSAEGRLLYQQRQQQQQLQQQQQSPGEQHAYNNEHAMQETSNEDNEGGLGNNGSTAGNTLTNVDMVQSKSPDQ